MIRTIAELALHISLHRSPLRNHNTEHDSAPALANAIAELCYPGAARGGPEQSVKVSKTWPSCSL